MLFARGLIAYHATEIECMCRPQETGSLGTEGAAFGFSNSVAPSPYSAGGNPFG